MYFKNELMASFLEGSLRWRNKFVDHEACIKQTVSTTILYYFSIKKNLTVIKYDK